MSQVHPFAGLRYSLDHISTLADVISPPYDKISPQERDELWNSHENNIVKLILPPPGGRNVDYATQFSSTEAGDWCAEAARAQPLDTGGNLSDRSSPVLYLSTDLQI